MNSGNIDKVFIFGAGGMLGRYLYAYFQRCGKYNKVVGLERSDFEVIELRQGQIEGVLHDLGADANSVIINAIGLIPQAVSADVSAREYMTVNAIFPHYLAFACAQFGTRMFQVSTDCVFSGRKSHDSGLTRYLEDTEPDEEHPYGFSKGLGEPLADGCSVLRSSLIGEDPIHGRSLLQWVLDEGSTSDSIDGYKNHFWNGITCLQLSKIIHEIIERNLFWKGVRHFFSPGRLTKFDLLSIIVEEYELQCTVSPYYLSEKIDKCLGTLYDLNEYVEIPSTQQQIRELRKFQF